MLHVLTQNIYIFNANSYMNLHIYNNIHSIINYKFWETAHCDFAHTTYRNLWILMACSDNVAILSCSQSELEKQ